MLQWGIDNVAAYEHELLTYATEKLTAIPQLRIIGNADNPDNSAGMLAISGNQ